MVRGLVTVACVVRMRAVEGVWTRALWGHVWANQAVLMASESYENTVNESDLTWDSLDLCSTRQ